MKRKRWAIGCIAVLGGLVYFLFNPENSQIFPKCPFLFLFNLKCPGCGSQRAIHALLHLNLKAAFGYNALLVATLPLIILLSYAEYHREKKADLYKKLNQTKLILSYFCIVILWWIGRNIFDW